MSAKKDTGLNEALSFIMGKGHETGTPETRPQYGHIIATTEPRDGHKSTSRVIQKGSESIAKETPTPKKAKKEKLVNHHIGLYPSDWQALERMADAEGGTVAVLIRRAIREMLVRASYRE